MEKVYIGEIIREQRVKLKMSQEELCDQICSPVTLSRLETGDQAPYYRNVKALLEKLGLSNDLYKVFNSKKELDVEDMEKTVRAKVVAFNKAASADRTSRREDALKALDELEALSSPLDPLTRQRILRDRIVLGTPEGPYSPKEQRELLLEALHLTAPGFDPDNIERFRYTQEEAGLINQLAITYAQSGETDRAIAIYRQLLHYIQKNNRQLSRYAGQLTMVSLNYAIELDKTGRYEEAIEIAEAGRKACVSYSEHQFHPGLLYVMAECWHHLGDDEASRELYTQAYYLYKAFDGGDNLELLKKDAQEQLGMIFE